MTADIPDYDPTPPDTSGIILPTELTGLIESLASVLHDVWARQRLDQGWKYGPVRDDNEKTHPDLVPYAALSEQEKEYDRQSAIQTIKGIMALNYVITKTPSKWNRPK